MATMLQLRAKVISNLRAQHPSFPLSQGIAEFRRQRIIPPETEADKAFPPQALWAWGHSEETSPFPSSVKQVLEQAREKT